VTSFAELTTLRVGGPAGTVLAPADTDALIAAARQVWESGEEWLALGGGSNLVVADEGFDGVVLRLVTRGIELVQSDGARRRVRVAAGEPWDGFVAATVANGWRGVEALSGIPGSVGASPVQNVGAYGQEVSDTLVAVDVLDYSTGALERVEAEALELGYRSSVLKHGRRGIVTAVEFDLVADDLGTPVRYSQLASRLGVELGTRVSVADVRAAVLALRSGKGMVLDPNDPDSVSAGSFFTNPIVSRSFAGTLPADAPRYPIAPEPADAAVPLGLEPALPPVPADDRVKLSAAWLIEHAGLSRGFSLPGSRAAISSKHTLALVNRGGASAADIAELGRYVQTRVVSEFGVLLHPEPQLVGLSL
jgi:UDP-N-acetylmuramate dehydrogenase